MEVKEINVFPFPHPTPFVYQQIPAEIINIESCGYPHLAGKNHVKHPVEHTGIFFAKKEEKSSEKENETTVSKDCCNDNGIVNSYINTTDINSNGSNSESNDYI